ncbi:MAG: alpha/beta fold hydrolase [Candidatus Bathyarchaeia archaeon]
MHRAKILALVVLLFTLTFASGVFVANVSCVPPFWPRPPLNIRPIVFVHGGSGSAQQFESQAMRFTSNGYPHDYIKVFEYDSSHQVESLDQILVRLDAFVDDVLEATKAEKIDLIGHSYGGWIILRYLHESSAAREKVAHCVVLDSLTTLMRSLNTAPEGVETLAIWGMVRNPAYPQIIQGAKNVYFSNQAHVEVCTSAETFAEMFKFFTGEEPATTDIIPEPPGQVWISGRVVIFPLNVYIEYPQGRPAILEIWEIDSNTGYRIHKKPVATFEIKAPYGEWGPIKVKAGVHYEFCLLREGLPPHHHYREPFYRSNYWITLLTSLPGGIADQVERSDQHAALLIIRNKEFLGDLETDNDILEINGFNVITAAVFTKTKMVNSVWLFDKNSDKVSDITKGLSPFHGLTFQTGLDFYIPAADPPNGTITIKVVSRGTGGLTQVINVPNWASSKHRITIQFNDYVQEVNSFQEYMRLWRPKK